ncbi:MAG: response regulator [Gemmatimonadales bacterium]|jgi:CheY-like chemotaxis protein
MPGEKKVLVVDDDSLVLDSVAAALEGAGFQVLTADSAEKALELAGRVEPDVVVADLKMPGMDGVSLLGRLKEDIAPTPRMVIYSASQPPDQSAESMRGVLWVSKAAGHETLLEALQAAPKGSGDSSE